MTGKTSDTGLGLTGLTWRMRVALGVVIALAGVSLWFTNSVLLTRFSEAEETRAALRLEQYATDLTQTIRRNRLLPELLATDPVVQGALSARNTAALTARMEVFKAQAGAQVLVVTDPDGTVVAATLEDYAAADFSSTDPYLAAVLDAGVQFGLLAPSFGSLRFVFAQAVRDGTDLAGLVFVKAALAEAVADWQGGPDAVMVVDDTGQVVLSTEPDWQGQTPDAALTVRSADSAIRRGVRRAQGLAVDAAEPFVRGREVARTDQPLNFQGWRIVSFTTYDRVRQQVNGVLALEVMVFSLIVAAMLLFATRRSALQALGFQRESEELKTLNQQLQREISQREQAERELEVAEQTIEQSSKLAALGEMAAAVSHELNQPLAAMRTYLAGAKTLLERSRTVEALSSFQRIDDLIGRMGSITGQLKTHARKGGPTLKPVAVEDAVQGALDIMGMPFSEAGIAVTRTFPPEPTVVMGDQARLEQVLINLFRNALDAMAQVDAPSIDVLVVQGDSAKIIVRDTGPGIENLDDLFEPFYTTKEAGEGVGLGLAISSGIIADFGGRMTAFNGVPDGAVFEIVLPLVPQ